MKKEDVKIGMKVVPFQKTVWGALSTSLAWKDAKKVGQDFLYVLDWSSSEQAFALGDKKDERYDGDYFRAEDFKPYKEKPESKVSNIKLIQNGTTTVVILPDGRKGIAKCNPADEYCEIDGINLAIVRAFEGSHVKYDDIFVPDNLEGFTNTELLAELAKRLK